MRTKLFLSLLGALLAFSTTASAQRFSEHVWSRQDPRPHYNVGHLPPALRYEHIGQRPSFRHVWIPGCWQWRVGYSDWTWIDGYWALPPYEGVVYVSPSYVRSSSGVVYVDGGWCEPAYARSEHAATGTVIGGVLGGVIGHQSHNTGLGILLGAVVGHLFGHEVDRQEADQRYDAAQARATQGQVAQAQANANLNLEKEKLIAQGRVVTDEELAVARERARVAQAKLAAAKANQPTDLGRAAALENANAEADAAEAELKAMNR